MKRAVIYLRVSTEKQAVRDADPEGYSIPAQREACLRKAQSLNSEVVDEYVDRGESARSAARPALQAMLARIKTEADVDYIIVHKVDRLARNRADDVGIGLALKMAHVQLVSVSENIDETPSGQLLHGIMTSIAEFYSQNLASEILKGTVQKAASGGTPTRAPLGYLNVRDKDNGEEIRTIAVDPDRAPLVRHAFEAYASGDHTMRSCLEEVTDMGLTSRPTPKSPAKPVSFSYFARMLQNRYYIGFVSYRGVEYPGRHEPLISAELFNRVQEVIRSHAGAGEKQRINNHYLKGTVFCQQCGSRLCLTNAKGRYLYFFCTGRQKGNGCPQRYILAEDIEDEVERLYRILSFDPEYLVDLKDRVHTETGKLREKAARESARQEKRLVNLRSQRLKLLNAHYEGAVPLDLLRSEQARLSREITIAEAAVSEADVDVKKIEQNLSELSAVVANWAEAYRTNSPEGRRRLNQAIWEKLLIKQEEVVEAKLAPPFNGLLADYARTTYYRHSNPAQLVFSGAGSNKETLVEPRGLEPLTSALQRQRSTS
jgi:site-specific DNA recombinase